MSGAQVTWEAGPWVSNSGQSVMRGDLLNLGYQLRFACW